MASLTELGIMALAGGSMLGITGILLLMAARFGPLLALVALEPFAAGLCLFRRAARSWRDWRRVSRAYLRADSFGLELVDGPNSASVLYSEILAVHREVGSLRLELDGRPDLSLPGQLDGLDELGRDLRELR